MVRESAKFVTARLYAEESGVIMMEEKRTAPAPDAVVVALDRAEHVARVEMRDCPQHSTCVDCPDTTICQGWKDVKTYARARSDYAAKVKALEAADKMAADYEMWHFAVGGEQSPLTVAAFRAARGAR